jgi:hypothetical protein
MLKITALILACLSLSSAHARFHLLTEVYSSAGDSRDYRIGDEWGKKSVNPKDLRKSSPQFVRAASATAFIPVGGTGFYLGKFDGVHVLATNHHVCPTERDCVNSKADFRVIKKSFKMTKLFISLPDVDLALLAIDVPAKDEAVMKRIAQNFSFRKEIQKGQGLMTIGYGTGENPYNEMMANQDSDCKVFSDTKDYRHLADPDEINPGDYKAWSFAHGCDISHGDSGSAMVDRETGEVMGIVWTGKIPKSRSVQSSVNLEKMFTTSSPLIWKELSYAVPASKIGDYLSKLTRSREIEDDARRVFMALLK